MESLRAVLPEQRDVANLLRQIQDLAIRSNLTIQGFTPQPVAPRELPAPHEEWPIRLQFEGTYHNVGLFFDRISKLSRIINVSGVSIRALEPPELDSTITRRVHRHDVRLARDAAAGRDGGGVTSAVGG